MAQVDPITQPQMVAALLTQSNTIVGALTAQTNALIAAMQQKLDVLIGAQVSAAAGLQVSTLGAAGMLAEITQSAEEATGEYRRVKTLDDYTDHIQK